VSDVNSWGRVGKCLLTDGLPGGDLGGSGREKEAELAEKVGARYS
jgi:hypothetical protein